MKFPQPESQGQRIAMAIVLTLIAVAILVYFLRLPGVLISLLLIAVAWGMLHSRPDKTEKQTLRSSIALSAEDIQNVLDEFDRFQNSPEADVLADRTLYRPALMDFDCSDEDIEQFHYQYSSSKRFLNRMEARLSSAEIEIQELEQLLRITDRRAADLKEKWVAARRSAFHLGQNYRDKQ